MLIWILIGGCIGMLVIKKAAIEVYKKTGVNTLKGFSKFLWYVEACALLCAVGLESELLLILAVVVSAALQFLLCMKAGIPSAVIMGILHGIGGGLFGVINVALFFLNLATGKGPAGMGKLFSFDESAYEVQKVNNDMEKSYAETQKRAEEIKKEEQERADAYAQHQGFRDAEDAERTAGIKTGRPQD